jgi:hypothetical protein
MVVQAVETRSPSRVYHRCCMAVVSSCREMLGSVPQRAQPSPPVIMCLGGQPVGIREEGGDDVKSAWLLRLGQHTRYNGQHSAWRPGNGKLIVQSWPQCRSGAATRPREAGVASNRVSARRGEYVPGPCTHRPSRHGSGERLKFVGQPGRLGGSDRGRASRLGRSRNKVAVAEAAAGSPPF